MRKRKLLNIVWSGLSAIVSLLFVGHGIWLFSQLEHETDVAVVASITFLYGVLSLIFLILAWTKPIKYLFMISVSTAVAFLAFQLGMSLDLGIISGLEWVAFIIVGIMLSANCMAVKKITIGNHLA